MLIQDTMHLESGAIFHNVTQDTMHLESGAIFHNTRSTFRDFARKAPSYTEGQGYAERLETSHTRRRLTEGQGIRSRTFRDFAYTRRLTQKWGTRTYKTLHYITFTLTSRLE